MYVCGIDKQRQSQSSDPGTSNSAQAPDRETPSPKLDKAALKAELVKMEQDITAAVYNGDITLLSKSTTDDFKLTGVDGKVQNKNEALADVKKEKNVKACSITDAELLSSSEDSAVLAYTQNITLKTGQSGRRPRDGFIRQDRRQVAGQIGTADDDQKVTRVSGQDRKGFAVYQRSLFTLDTYFSFNLLLSNSAPTRVISPERKPRRARVCS